MNAHETHPPAPSEGKALAAFLRHLRVYVAGLLRGLSNYGRSTISFECRGDPATLIDQQIVALGLQGNPMIGAVRRLIAQGYRIRPADQRARLPVTKVYLLRHAQGVEDRVTVEADGSVKQGWA